MSKKYIDKYCSKCGKHVRAEEQTPNHKLHFWITFVLGVGSLVVSLFLVPLVLFWLVVWGLDTLSCVDNYRCPHCGFKSRINAVAKSLTALISIGIIIYVISQTPFHFYDSSEYGLLSDKYEKIGSEKSEYDLLSDKYEKIGSENAAKQREEDAAKEARAREAACRKNVVCYGNKAESFARFTCAERVEQLAQHGFEWTFIYKSEIFSSFGWLDEEAGSVTMIGDAIRFQDASGE